jgi:hypothetical protein
VVEPPQLAVDDESHDLVCALQDAVHAQVTHAALQRVVLAWMVVGVSSWGENGGGGCREVGRAGVQGGRGIKRASLCVETTGPSVVSTELKQLRWLFQPELKQLAGVVSRELKQLARAVLQPS